MNVAVFCVNTILHNRDGEPFLLDRTFRTEDAANIYVDQMKFMTGDAVLYRIESYGQGEEVPHQLED